LNYGEARTEHGIHCDYNSQYLTYTSISKLEFSKGLKNDSFFFSGTCSQKVDTRIVAFVSCPKVEFIPKELLEEFYLTDTFYVLNSDISILTNDFFPKNFVNVSTIALTNDNIWTIEPEAFFELPHLKYLFLRDNQIKHLNFLLFKHNPELRHVGFPNNDITTINPNIFENLDTARLTYNFLGNPCVDDKNQDDLSKCNANCRLDAECSSLIEKELYF
jgi:Leucine-rich repeat (LRR) protein